jgi:hypothetical protein
MTHVVQELASLFGMMVLLTLMAAGLVMMFSPNLGRQLLKNVLIALALFLAGDLFVQVSCRALRSPHCGGQ